MIVQKSLKEGFGLTVTEGLWKEKPRLPAPWEASLRRSSTSLPACWCIPWRAAPTRSAICSPTPIAAHLGKNGREHAKENFLITVNLKRWLLLFQILLGMAKPHVTA